MRVLVTAFEPFGGDPENASLEAVRRLAAGWHDEHIELVAAVLPVSFERSQWMLEEAVARANPDVVIAVGEAGARVAITPERFGVNEDDARIPDNDGAQPRGRRIDDGPERRASGLDVDAIVAAIRALGLAATASEDAGRFLCNHLAYLVAGLPVRGGFVHVPALRSRGAATVGGETDTAVGAAKAARGDAADPSAELDFDDLAAAIAAAVRVEAAR